MTRPHDDPTATASRVLTLPQAVTAGVRIGRYRVVRELGQGGMGQVLLADDTSLQRQVALKVIRGVAGESDGPRVRRFLREARQIAQLSHPHIGAVYDILEHEGAPVLAMEFVDGETLAERIATGPAAPELALRVARELAAALACAHGRGIVHRDLKPGNVMLTTSGAVKLLDFGLAKSVAEADSVSGDPITRTGVIVGTPAYMSPEQARGQRVDARSDVFSFGSLLYELITGERPFTGASTLDVLTAVVSHEVPALEAVDPLLAGTVARCLAKDPDARFADAVALARALLPTGQPGGAGLSVAAPKPTQPAGLRVAVMPFRNTTGADAHDWLGAGLLDTLIHELQRVPGVQVLGMALTGPALGRLARSGPPRPGALAEALGVSAVVHGSYQVAGARLRIHAGVHQRGEDLRLARLDGTIDEIFELQDGLCQQLATHLQPAVPALAEPPKVRDREAFEHYARGRLAMATSAESGAQEAILCFERALARDPDHTRALAGLGFARITLAHGQAGGVRAAMEVLERAVALDPRLANAWRWKAYGHVMLGEPALGVVAGERAVSLDPEDVIAWSFLGVARWSLLQSDGGGAAALRRTAEAFCTGWRLQPNNQQAVMNVGLVALQTGAVAIARRLFVESVPQDNTVAAGFRWIGGHLYAAFACLAMGDLDAAHTYVQLDLLALEHEDHVYAPQFRCLARVALAEVQLRRGEVQAALTHFRDAEARAEADLGRPGMVYHHLRARCGVAKALYHLGDTRQAAAVVGVIAASWQELRAPMHQGYGGGLAMCCFDLASARVTVGDLAGAVAVLREGLDRGWASEPMVASDPAFAPYLELPEVRDVVARAAAIDVLDWL